MELIETMTVEETAENLRAGGSRPLPKKSGTA